MVDPDSSLILMARNAGQRLPGAWAGDAFAVLDQEQGTVGRTLDQAVAGVKKPVGRPLQPDTPVWAAVEVDIDLTTPAHGQQLLSVDVETAAAVVS